jgi:hypothetical protein
MPRYRAIDFHRGVKPLLHHETAVQESAVAAIRCLTTCFMLKLNGGGGVPGGIVQVFAQQKP